MPSSLLSGYKGYVFLVNARTDIFGLTKNHLNSTEIILKCFGSLIINAYLCGVQIKNTRLSVLGQRPKTKTLLMLMNKLSSFLTFLFLLLPLCISESEATPMCFSSSPFNVPTYEKSPSYNLLAPTEAPIVLIYQDADGVTHEIPMTEVGSLVAVDDAYDFTVLSVTGSILVEKVLKVSFGPQGSTDIQLPTPSGNMLGRLVEGKLTLIGVTGEVGIYDTGGALKAQVTATGGETIINIGHLPTGVYMVRNGKQTFKFMKK